MVDKPKPARAAGNATPKLTSPKLTSTDLDALRAKRRGIGPGIQIPSTYQTVRVPRNGGRDSEAPPPRPAGLTRQSKAPPPRPAGLTSQSGAAQSGTAGKVPPKSTTKKGIQNFDKNKADAEARRAASQVQKKAMGGKMKMVEKGGKKVPAFAADGVGKMAKGGKMTKGSKK